MYLLLLPLVPSVSWRGIVAHQNTLACSFRPFWAGFQREAARSVSLAVDACTSKHKQAQQEVTARAAEGLRRALEVAGEAEVARTKAVLGR